MRSTEFRSRFVLYVLLLTYISNQWCRYLLATRVSGMKLRPRLLSQVPLPA